MLSKPVFLGGPAEGPAPQLHHELTEGCFFGKVYRTTRKELQNLFVT